MAEVKYERKKNPRKNFSDKMCLVAGRQSLIFVCFSSVLEEQKSEVLRGTFEANTSGAAYPTERVAQRHFIQIA